MVAEMQEFKTAVLRELADQQIRFAPPAKRLEQLSRAEKLLSEIQEGKEYPYQYVCWRITDYRPESHRDVVIGSADLQQDLCSFIAELSRSMPAMPVEDLTEPVLTLEEMSKRFNVSTKTINRWRRRGLIGVPVVSKGRRQVGFLPSLVEPFLAANRDKVERGSRFSQLSDEEKEEILRRARRLARLGAGSLTEVSKRIARRLKRSPETVRYTIKNFDRLHPEDALYPSQNGPLKGETKDVIYSSYRRGIPVEALAKRFGRTRNSMYRVINEMHARRLLEDPLDYIYNESFDQPDAESEILGPMPGLEQFEAQRQKMHAPKDAPAELASLYEYPLLSREQEAHLFRKMNFLKHKAKQLRSRIDSNRARVQELEQVEELLEDAGRVKALLINCNMRLVVSIAKRHSAQAENFFELLSDGNVSLIRAVEKFDYSRGNKFSTYASWAIMKNFARSIPEDKKRRERYSTGHEEIFDAAPDVRTNEQETLASQEQRVYQVNRLLEYLEPRERQILRMRHGLDSEEMTLEQIGQQLKITKERVRQLSVRALNKLQSIAREQNLEQ
ncbi:MAG: sigma-70 family RNA polymerase sigma factor [Gemmataceae bacterium]